jgi:hypothetical protein
MDNRFFGDIRGTPSELRLIARALLVHTFTLLGLVLIVSTSSTFAQDAALSMIHSKLQDHRKLAQQHGVRSVLGQ